jgi:NAD(P)-dependent dehydrogenase (short-subunit alcohol dehydrogenase family)
VGPSHGPSEEGRRRTAHPDEHRGLERTGQVPEVNIDEWNKVFEINVIGTLRGIQTCAPLMRDSGGGSIINIGSVAGITGNFSTAYSSSKWALEGLSPSAAYVYATGASAATPSSPYICSLLIGLDN